MTRKLFIKHNGKRITVADYKIKKELYEMNKMKNHGITTTTILTPRLTPRRSIADEWVDEWKTNYPQTFKILVENIPAEFTNDERTMLITSLTEFRVILITKTHEETDTIMKIYLDNVIPEIQEFIKLKTFTKSHNIIDLTTIEFFQPIHFLKKLRQQCKK
jgi:hypothetical protein